MGANFAYFLSIEHHISRSDAPAAAVGSIDVPIAAAIIVAGRVAESAGDAVDNAGKPFELDECASGSLVKLDRKAWEAGEAEGGPDFVVAKTGTKAEGSKPAVPMGPRARDDQLSLEFFLVAVVT